MMPSCVLAASALPGVSALYSDFVCRFERVARFYPYDPRDPSALKRRLSLLDYPEQRRWRLVEALRKQNGDSPALQMLARPGTTVVVTGQQVGLFGGPAYSFYKALSAIRLAEHLSEQGTPAVAVFWMATEDHQWGEINHCWVLSETGVPLRLEILRQDEEPQPAGQQTVPHEALEQLRSALRGWPFSEAACDTVAQAYAPGRTLGAAFASLLRNLLGDRGLLCLDPLEPEIRQAMAPLLAEAIERERELAQAVLARGQELIEAGYQRQVRFEPGSSLFFMLVDNRRLPLRRNGDHYLCAGRRYSPAQLAASPTSLSPAALLRPVVQDWLLPVVASVLGPAEIAYWAQARPLYQGLGVSEPVILPRASWTLLDARTARLMERYGVKFSDFFGGEQALRERIAARLTPPALAAAIERSRQQIAQLLDEMGVGVSAFDASLARAFLKSRSKIMYQVGKIERKVAREALRRDERAAADARWMCNLIYPQRRLQERFYSLVSFLAWRGPELIDKLYAQTLPACLDHRLLIV